MAAAVVTTTVHRRDVSGSLRTSYATLAFNTGDYAAGGIAVTPQQFQLNNIWEICFAGAGLEVSGTPTAQVPFYNPATSKIQFFQSGAANAPLPEKGAEAFGSGASVRCIVFGN